MNTPIAISDHDDRALNELLDDRIYEFNSTTTGIDDGRVLNATLYDARGELIAGASGHTWGGCCEILRVWVAEAARGQRLGSRLMDALEQEAKRRGCTQMVLSSHSFQAPEFYRKRGFAVIANVDNYPVGHSNVHFIKYL